MAYLKTRFYFNRLPIFFGLAFTFLLIFNYCTTEEDDNSNHEIIALNIETLGEGIVNSPNAPFVFGDEITLSAIPSEGYYFERWEGLEQPIEDQELSFTLIQDIVITAVFLALPELSEEIEIYNPKGIDPNPVFMIENGGTKAYLVSKTGQIIQKWEFDAKLGNDLELFNDGSIMGLFKPEQVSFSFGGYGGILKKYDSNGNLIFEYELNSATELLHHDFEVLPNGNILLMVWEKFSGQDSKSMGYDNDGEIYLEKIIELNPTNKRIVWEWRSADHLIQDFNSEVSNYGQISLSPQKIDLNYFNEENGDLMHANGIFYDSVNDVIYLSVNFYSEVWVIPHHYTTDETKTNLGDLKYRFGNPKAYGVNQERLFFNNHHPSLVTLDPKTEGRFLIYMNGSREQQSIVYEFILPTYDSNPSIWTIPEVTWSFTNEELFFGKISGAYRLPNGNTLICEGDYGYWEVNRLGEIVWKYNGRGEATFWRGYVYP